MFFCCRILSLKKIKDLTKITAIIPTLNEEDNIQRAINSVLFADEIIIASGSWSQKLLKKLNTTIPIQAGKGYRIDVKKDTGIKIPAILTEAKVAVTPMDGFTRFAGTMEIGGLNNQINATRVKTITKAGENYYKDLDINQLEIGAVISLPLIDEIALAKDNKSESTSNAIETNINPTPSNLIKRIRELRKELKHANSNLSEMQKKLSSKEILLHQKNM